MKLLDLISLFPELFFTIDLNPPLSSYFDNWDEFLNFSWRECELWSVLCWRMWIINWSSWTRFLSHPIFPTLFFHFLWIEKLVKKLSRWIVQDLIILHLGMRMNGGVMKLIWEEWSGCEFISPFPSLLLSVQNEISSPPLFLAYKSWDLEVFRLLEELERQKYIVDRKKRKNLFKRN